MIIIPENKSISVAPQETFIVTYHRVVRSPDEETFQPRIPKKVDDFESTEEDLNETQFLNQQSSSEEIPIEYVADEGKENSQLIESEPNKSKPSEPKKYNANDFKTKVSAETKTLSSNESTSEKQKLPIYNPNPVIKYNNSFKKDPKVNSSFSDYNFKSDNSNSKVPSKFMLEKKKLKSDSDEVLMNITRNVKVNETHLMSDQPIATDSDLTHNTTDITEDDSLDGFLQNTSKSIDL